MTPPLKVMHVITDLDTGGAEMMLSRLVAAADRSIFAMSVVSLMPPGPLGAEIARQGIPVQSLGLGRGVPDPRGVLRLLRLLRRERPDILQTWLYHADLLGLVAARLAGVPHLLWNLRCSDMELARYSRMSAALPRLLALLSAMPDLVIANSVAGKAVHERLGYHPKRWEILPNGIDVERFRPDPQARARLRAELGLAPEALVICLPARFDPMKDHATFLAAASRFAPTRPQARFVLAGRGCDPSNAALGALIAATACAERVLLLGERRDMPALMAASDIVTLSSAFGEGFPNVLGEAMACGVPAVSTDVGDAAAILGATGRVVPPRDPAALAAGWEALDRLGEEERAALGRAARARVVERYALPAVVAGYEALYEELAAHG